MNLKKSSIETCFEIEPESGDDTVSSRLRSRDNNPNESESIISSLRKAKWKSLALKEVNSFSGSLQNYENGE